MTPEQARAALWLTGRLIKRHGLTVEEAVTAVAQKQRQETGPHTHLVAAEAAAVMSEATATLRALMDAVRPAAEAAAAAMAALVRALQTAPQPPARARRDRPAWVSPYGPPRRR
ncbi:hypothetical protein ACFVH9_08550 [Streptomyces hirsutus]|uniref:hypothetical protein n=1 Tax=Streptomyces hirsutus TaxID=35620 RepID=UPI00362D01E3